MSDRQQHPVEPRGPGDSKIATAADEEAVLWRHLVAAQDLAALAEAWLRLQCRMIDGARSGIVAVTEKTGESLSLVSTWPDTDPPSPTLLHIAERAVAEHRGVARKATRAAPNATLAYPLIVNDEVHGVVAIQLQEHHQVPLGGAMRQLQWGAAWIRDRLRVERFDMDEQVMRQTTATLDIVATALQREKFVDACQATITELALRCKCERVSIGVVRRDHARIVAISHSAEFGQRMNLVRMVEAAMDEAIDQHTIITTPASPGGPPLTTQAHEALSRHQGGVNLLTIPLLAGDHSMGALLCERPANQPFDQATTDTLAASAALLGPVLEEKRLNDRWLLVKAGDVLAKHARDIIGPDHMRSKVIALCAFLAIAFCFFATGSYRVSGDARVEGAVQRVLVAAFDGYIREAPARAGDIVTEGQLLASIDDRDLALERLTWVTDRQEKQFELERALSDRNRAEVNVIRTQIAKAEAQIRLIDESLGRARIVAPFDGLVVSGDLSQSIGATTQRGQVLYEIAPLREYRVVVLVGEDQISDISVGQRGELLVTALPDKPLPIEVTTITPVSESAEGKNTFRVEAQLDDASVELRPGMEGIAKLDVDERRLVWIWSRQLRNWLRLAAWRWIG